MLENKRIFITGGAGFIGSTLALKLSGKNEICLFDSLRRDARQFTLDKTGEGKSNVTLVQGDVRDADLVEAEIAKFKPTHIVHAAAIAGIDTVGQRPADTLEINSLGTRNILHAATKVENLERVVCFSTSEIFGPEADHVDEKSPAVVGAVGEPRWVYAVSKLYSEHLAFAYFKQHGLPTACVRPFNVYGPGQVGEGALSTFVQKAIKGETLMLRGDGKQIRAWCYVDDMVEAVMICLENDNAIGKTFNIGHTGSACTVKELAEKIVQLVGSESKIEHTEGMSADVYTRIPDDKYPEETIGFKAKVDLEEGLERSIGYFREKIARGA